MQHGQNAQIEQIGEPGISISNASFRLAGQGLCLSPYDNTSSAFISILLNANSFLPKSLRDAPR